MTSRSFSELDDVQTRFWEKVAVGEEDECWVWQGNPRGQFRVGSSVVHARRVAWELTYGTPPPRTHLKTTCGERLCCNPAHISYRSRAHTCPTQAGVSGRTRFSATEKRKIRQQYAEGMRLRDLCAAWNANAAVLLRIVKTDV